MASFTTEPSGAECIRRSRSGDGGRVNANAVDQNQVSERGKIRNIHMPHAEPHIILRTYGSTKMCPKKKRPSAEGGENIFPSAGEETTNHSKGKPESEWSISSVPRGEFPWSRPRANGSPLSLRAIMVHKSNGNPSMVAIDQV